MFQTNRLDNYWNGTFNGKPLPSSDFWYRFENSQNREIIKGHFSLLR
ncbi:T9SS type B sorting domain-containing protein [Maribacter sp. HS]